MAVAAKSAPGAAKTEYRQQSNPRVHRRRRKKRGVTVTRLLLCIVGLLCLLGYVGMYAKVTRCGYNRAELARQIREAEMENQSLKAQIQMLSSPGRLAAAATLAGMQPSTESLFIGGQETTKIAKAE